MPESYAGRGNAGTVQFHTQLQLNMANTITLWALATVPAGSVYVIFVFHLCSSYVEIDLVAPFKDTIDIVSILCVPLLYWLLWVLTGILTLLNAASSDNGERNENEP